MGKAAPPPPPDQHIRADPELVLLEATTGFEPVITVLQTAALPLGYVAGDEMRILADLTLGTGERGLRRGADEIAERATVEPSSAGGCRRA